MPTGHYDRSKSAPNSGMFKKGHVSIHPIKPNSGMFKKGHVKVGGIAKGDHLSIEARNKISTSLRGITGASARRWKGSNAGYGPKHSWIARHYGKASVCEINPLHTGKRFEWANISREYKREKEDYISMCPSCHRKFDIHKLTIEEMRKLYG